MTRATEAGPVRRSALVMRLPDATTQGPHVALGERLTRFVLSVWENPTTIRHCQRFSGPP
jgi:hypothetical protein